MSKWLDDAGLGILESRLTPKTKPSARNLATAVPAITITRPFLEGFTMVELADMHAALCTRGATLMRAKNHDYTAGQHPLANFLAADARGVPAELGLMLRVDDKLKRLQTFITQGTLKVSGEGVKDSIIDVINYMVLLAGLIYCRTGDPTLLGKEDV